MLNKDIVLILGAGFSANAGICVQNKFMDFMVKPSDWLEEEDQVMLDKEITRHICNFLSSVFCWNDGEPLPTLEEIFTFIDISSGSGHNLGKNYPPAKLRAIRRFLIYKLFVILDKHINGQKKLINF